MEIHKINNVNIKPIELIEVFANPEDAELIYNLQKQMNAISKKDKNGESVFAVDDVDFILSIINSKRGDIVLYYNDDELVGFFELTCPDNPNDLEEEYNISKYLPEIDISNTGVAESFVVLPKYRGNGLQVKMFERMEELASERGITSLIGTVHPENDVSISNFKKAGYNTITKFKVFYGERIFEHKTVNPKLYEEVSEHVKIY